ncbi:MAG: M20 aminoacylase family protein [Pseudomonadota bacterium]
MQPIPNSIAAMAPELAEWRQDLHRHPELGFQEARTAGIVAEKLRSWGFDAVETGIAKTGVVGVLHGRSGPGEAILLRADMDALPILEETGADHASTTPGTMHACGHDGHTTMLLGAAKHLAETRNFDGTVYFCFQPAEEGGAGAKVMLDEGLLERFPARAVYGMHNWPGMPVGTFSVRPGPVMAASDEFNVVIRGKGGHAAQPHSTSDPLIAGAHLVTALQTIVSRKIDPLKPAVVSITEFHAGTACNVIADEAKINGTTRSFDPDVYDVIITEMHRICENIAAGMGVEVALSHESQPYPATINDAAEAEFAGRVLDEVVGAESVDRDLPPTMGGEDFAFMSNARPGCFVFIGNGDSTELHTATYDFDDSSAPYGVAYWTRLVEMALPAG